MASVSWTSTTGGSWNTAANWSGGDAPLTGDDVAINTPGDSITVTYSTGSLTLDSLATGATDLLSVTGGTLSTQGGGYTLQGGLTISGGAMRLVASTNGGAGGSVGGTLTQTGGSLFFVNDAAIQNGVLDQTAGTITIAHGVLSDEDSAGTIAGTITGAGGFVLTNNNNGTTILAAGAVISTADFEITSGTLSLQEKLSYANRFLLTSTLDLNGNAATLSGHDALDGDVNGGSLTLSGTGRLDGLTLENGAFLNITSTINQTGGVQLGGNTGTGTLNIASGGTLRVTGNDSIDQGNNAGILINKGTLEKTAGGNVAGATTISTAITNTGTINAEVGTINFSGPGGGVQSTITGTLESTNGITGTDGTIEFSNGSYILGASGANGSLALDSHRLLFTGSNTDITIATALSYGGNWEQSGGLLLFENNLTLSGITDLVGGELKGTATITDTGALTLGNGVQLEGNLSFLLNGNVDQLGGVNFGDISDSVDQATLTAGHSWDLEGQSSISGSFGTITNQGTFVKENGLQNDTVGSDILNTGTMLVEAGTLSLSGHGTLGGSIGGAGVLDVSGQFALAAGLSLSVGELILDSQNNDIQASLGGNVTFANTYAQEGGTIALNNFTLTLTGTTSLDSGAILGSGEVLVTGPAIINSVALSQGGLLQFNGTTEQTGNVNLTGGSTAPTLTIGPKGSYTIDNGLNIGGPGNSVVGTLSVAGTLHAGGSTTSTIAAAVVDSGQIQISHGQMVFLGPLTGGGSVSLSAGGVLALDTSAATSTGISFGAGGGSLYLQDPSAYGGTIGGFASGDSVELNGFAFNGTLTTLTVSGDLVTITEPNNGPSITLTFSTSQTGSLLMLGEGSHGGLALIHV
jgi:hypothetical protein